MTGILFRTLVSTSIMLLLLSPLAADQIVMKNGDRVTGRVVKKDAATLTVKTVHFGVIAMPWSQVESIATDAPLTVVLPGDQAVQGTLATTGQTVRVLSLIHISEPRD